MKPPYPMLLVAHRGFGEGLLTAAESILGERPEIDHLTNDGLSTEELGRRIDEWLAAQPGPALILADLGFGSCCQTSRRVTRERGSVGILAGVSLPILLATVQSREHEDLLALMKHLADRGRGSLELYLGGYRV
jgi:mannose/fructose-specific phosphotransferase system component IIA